MNIEELLRQADFAVGKGHVLAANELLLQAAAACPADSCIWLRLAASYRASGNPDSALAAVHEALKVAPTDFAALLMRATLLDGLDEAAAPEAWERALANRPFGELPPEVAGIVARAEERQTELIASREAHMKSAMAETEARASPTERKRIERFRNNVLHRTIPYHSTPTEFHFPELIEREFHPVELFPWLRDVEEATDAIEAEFKTVMHAERAELVPYVQYEDHLPLNQWRSLNRNPDWTAIHLLFGGERNETNSRYCPQTMRLLEELPQPRIPGASPNAMFSLLAPHTSIPPHVGVNNARLVCHLPLVIPEGCSFRVGGETRLWKRGEPFVFDDTIEHEALNPSDELRVVFIFDVWHPDLSALEQRAVAELISAPETESGAV